MKHNLIHSTNIKVKPIKISLIPRLLVLGCLLGLLVSSNVLHATSTSVAVSDLRCEYRVNPLGVDAPKPRLSWKSTSNRRGEMQTAYQILVASTAEKLAQDQGDLWDSQQMASQNCLHIEYGGIPLKTGVRCFWKVRIWDAKGKASAWSPVADWTMGVLAPADWQAKWIRSPEADQNIAVWLRKSFDLDKLPSRAVINVAISGYAELYINGKKAGSDVLTPSASYYYYRNFYDTYDVTKLLKPGRNVIGIWMGKGWAIEKKPPMVMARMEIESNGNSRLIGSDSTWRARASCYRNIGGWSYGSFGGERLDVRDQVPDWCRPNADQTGWVAAVEVAAPKVKLDAQSAPFNRIGKEIPAVAITPIEGNRYVIDFGTALTGWLRLKFPKLESGAVVKMSFADAPDTEVGKGKINWQTFGQISEFVSEGGEDEVFQNKFNYQGFRYVIVEGLPCAPEKSDATALLVESDLEAAGKFECSNDLINRIFRLNEWTQRCLNLGGYYVDCPHRERMGYGDGQVAAEGFMSSFRADGFYRKFIEDWRLLQKKDGVLPNTAPFGGGGGGPGWPGFVASMTWRHYLYYGDRRVLEENYETIRRYVDWLEGKCVNKVLRRYGDKWSFIGDWVAPGRGMDTKNWPDTSAAELFNNGYRVYQWELLGKISAALGRTDEVERCRQKVEEIRPVIQAAFFDVANNRYVIDEQAYYLMPLMTGITPKAARPAVFKNLEKNIVEKNGGHFDTGMLGTYFLMEYLRESGRNDLVYTMFNQTTFPSWGYFLEKGATTCWEQWNGYASHIHSCFTSANNWLYQGPGGIMPDQTAPGFKKIIIKPAIVGDLKWVNCYHDSPYGRIVSNWKRDNKILTMDITIPVNTTATMYIPASKLENVKERGIAAGKAMGVKFICMEKGCAIYEVGAGNYKFTASK
jgi:alpha-L-rhamnosidase